MNIPIDNDSRAKRLCKNTEYPNGEQHPPKLWWKIYILLQHGKEWANVALLDSPLKLCVALKSKNASKWEAVMQEVYDLLMANGTWELTNLTNDCKNVRCKWIFYTKRDEFDEFLDIRHG